MVRTIWNIWHFDIKLSFRKCTPSSSSQPPSLSSYSPSSSPSPSSTPPSKNDFSRKLSERLKELNLKAAEERKIVCIALRRFHTSLKMIITLSWIRITKCSLETKHCLHWDAFTLIRKVWSGFPSSHERFWQALLLKVVWTAWHWLSWVGFVIVGFLKGTK